MQVSRRMTLVLAACCLAAGVGALTTSHARHPWLQGLWTVISLAAGAISLPEIARELPPRVRKLLRDLLRDHGGHLLLALLLVVTLGDLALGQMPASRDHSIHYLQTRILVDDLLPTGHLAGWSDRLAMGIPFGDSYPVLGYLWVAAAHLLTFGLVSLRTSYAWGIWAMWLLSVAGVYLLGRTLWSELRPRSTPATRAWAGSLAGAAFLLDPGASRQGGWEYLMFHGVWPQQLSSALGVAGLLATARALARPSPRRLAVASALLAGALLAHPFGLLAVGGAALAWVPALLSAEREAPAPPAGRVLAGIHVAAGLLAAWWYVPFFLSAGEMGRSPVSWSPLGQLDAELLRGGLLERGTADLAYLAPAATVGLALVALRGGLLGRMTAITVVGLLVAGSTDSITALRLDLLLPAFKNLQFPRYAIVLAPLWWALSGVGLVATAAGIAAWLRARAQPVGPRRAALLLALALPLVAPLLAGPSSLLPRPVGGVDTLASGDAEDTDTKLLARLREEAARLGRPARVAFLRAGMSGATYPLLALADAGARAILFGHIPAVNFAPRVALRGPGTLKDLGVDLVVYDRKLHRKHALHGKLGKSRRVGKVRLARPADGEVAVPRAARARAAGVEFVPGDAHSTEDRTFEVRGVDPERGADVDLLVPPYWRWRVELDGASLPWEPAPMLSGAIQGMRVHVPSSGELRLTYARQDIETDANRASWAALLLVVLALPFGRPLPLARRRLSPGARRAQWILLVAIASLLVALAQRRQRRQLARTWATARSLEPDEPDPKWERAFVTDLADAGAWHVRWSPDLCTGLLGKDPRRGCTSADAAPRLGLAYRRPYLYRCVRITVPPHGYVRLHMDPTPGQEIFGWVQREPRRAGKRLAYRVVGVMKKAAKLGDARREFRVPPERAAKGMDLRLSNKSGREEAVCLAAAAFDPPAPTP